MPWRRPMDQRTHSANLRAGTHELCETRVPQDRYKWIDVSAPGRRLEERSRRRPLANNGERS